MDNLQYTKKYDLQDRILCFKPYYKWIIFNIEELYSISKWNGVF